MELLLSTIKWRLYSFRRVHIQSLVSSNRWACAHYIEGTVAGRIPLHLIDVGLEPRSFARMDTALVRDDGVHSRCPSTIRIVSITVIRGNYLTVVVEWKYNGLSILSLFFYYVV